ncbi:MAG: hypothetical protein JWP75_2928 [Frondihabitans sp.]|nr:hypothetical protein [Frondihabitans sp.]
MNAPQKLATPAEAAAWLDIKPRRLAALRRAGEGPKPTVLGPRTIRYAWRDVIDYAAACRARANGRA